MNEDFSLKENEIAAIGRSNGRRSKDRVPYDGRVQVAEYDNNGPVRFDQFIDVAAKDLTANGIGFYVTEKLESDSIVVALGDRYSPIYLTADVVHSRFGFYGGKKQYIIGCKFTGRVMR